MQTAQRTDPVPAADRDLLHAIPANAPLPRPVLDSAEPVTSLYSAVITSAERARVVGTATAPDRDIGAHKHPKSPLHGSSPERVRQVPLQYQVLRSQVGTVVWRSAWKNLVFTDGPGSGKSRAARAVARTYRELKLLEYGNLREVTAADLTGATPQETGTLVGETIRRAGGDLLMINDAHAWYSLHDHGRHALRRLYQELTDSRNHLDGQLAVILAGQAGPLRDMLHATPALVARFPAIINFPGYSASQLAAVFATLAAESGFTPDAEHKAATVLTQTEADHSSGNARLAVQLLDQAVTSQARRVAIIPQSQDLAMLTTIHAADIPGRLDPNDPPADDERPGQYL